jgi:hypothetical protein
MGSKLRQKTTPLARAPGTSLVPFNTAHKLLNLIFLLCYQSVLSPSYLREKICTPELHLKIKRPLPKPTARAAPRRPPKPTTSAHTYCVRNDEQPQRNRSGAAARQQQREI